MDPVQDEVAEVEAAPRQSFTTDRGQGEGIEAPLPRDSSPLHKVKRWLSAALAKGLGRSASKDGKEVRGGGGGTKCLPRRGQGVGVALIGGD